MSQEVWHWVLGGRTFNCVSLMLRSLIRNILHASWIWRSATFASRTTCCVLLNNWRTCLGYTLCWLGTLSWVTLWGCLELTVLAYRESEFTMRVSHHHCQIWNVFGNQVVWIGWITPRSRRVLRRFPVISRSRSWWPGQLVHCFVHGGFTIQVYKPMKCISMMNTYFV